MPTSIRKILVTGASGQLGAAIVQEFRRDSDVVAPGHADCDLADHDKVMQVVAAVRPDVIINCASYNAVDAAEEHPEVALQVNAFGVRSLARAAGEIGAMLVHYSTDFVFDGTADRPYTEDDRPNPQSIYACSKLLGEWFAADVPGHYVLRVESLFGHVPGEGRAPKGSVAGIIDGIVEGRAVKVFADRTASPTYIIDAASATRRVIERNLPAGVYHCVNAGLCTWRELAEEAARTLGHEARLEPVTLEQMALRAVRPKFCALSISKLRSAGIEMPTWKDALGRYLKVCASDPTRASEPAK